MWNVSNVIVVPLLVMNDQVKSSRMATVNFTRGEQTRIKFVQLLCSSYLTDGQRSQLTFLSVFNSFLSAIAFLENALVLIALHKESSRLWTADEPPSKVLLRSLATTDLCVGLISGPVYVVSQISVVNKNFCAFIGFISSRKKRNRALRRRQVSMGERRRRESSLNMFSTHESVSLHVLLRSRSSFAGVFGNILAHFVFFALLFGSGNKTVWM